MSLEMAHKVIVPPKKNYIPQFLKQQDINSYIIKQMSFGSVQNWTRASISWRAPTSPGNWRKLEQVSNFSRRWRSIVQS
jgi:hypothetical protein